MKKTILKFHYFNLLLLLAVSSLIMVACENKKAEKVETTTTETTMPAPAEVKAEVKDSLPPIDTDTKSSTRPETSKNH